MNKFTDWREYWKNRTDGGHKYKNESFIEAEYQEKSLYLGSGHVSMLDFGCGSAELLSYYSRNASRCFGCDFSETMLQKASERLNKLQISNVELVKADFNDVWDKIPDQLDIVTCCGVIQYFDLDMVNNFLVKSLSKIKNDGKIVIFDVIDRRYHYLWRCGIYRKYIYNFISLVPVMIKSIYVDIKSVFLYDSIREMGNSFHPQLFYDFSETHNLNCSIINSRYYPYRYHVILTN